MQFPTLQNHHASKFINSQLSTIDVEPDVDVKAFVFGWKIHPSPLIDMLFL